jgi:hypothetical protein
MIQDGKAFGRRGQTAQGTDQAEIGKPGDQVALLGIQSALSSFTLK